MFSYYKLLSGKKIFHLAGCILCLFLVWHFFPAVKFTYFRSGCAGISCLLQTATWKPVNYDNIETGSNEDIKDEQLNDLSYTKNGINNHSQQITTTQHEINFKLNLKPTDYNKNNTNQSTGANYNNHTTIASNQVYKITAHYNNHPKAKRNGIFGEVGILTLPNNGNKKCDFLRDVINCSTPTEIYKKNQSSYQLDMTSNLSMAELLTEMPDIKLGGRYIPKLCNPLQTLAVIIPFRDRNSHLAVLLRNLHRFLQDQRLAYQIFVVEQIGNETFNRGKLLNVGYLEAKALSPCRLDCVVLHDVDGNPEGPGPPYICSANPKQLSFKQDKFNFKMPYGLYMGGITNALADVYEKVNGHSNLYWGWGGEDDDYAYRIRRFGLHKTYPEEPVGRYISSKHKQHAGQKPNPCRMKLLERAGNRFDSDGLNNVQYTVHERVSYPLYQWMLVELHQAESEQFIAEQGYCKKPNKAR